MLLCCLSVHNFCVDSALQVLTSLEEFVVFMESGIFAYVPSFPPISWYLTVFREVNPDVFETSCNPA